MADMVPGNRKNKNKETRVTEIWKSQNFVAEVIETIQDCTTPFDVVDDESCIACHQIILLLMI